MIEKQSHAEREPEANLRPERPPVIDAGQLFRGTREVWIDLEGVRFMDSSGLGALVAGLKLARSRAGELRIVCEGQRSVRKVLEVTGLERVLERYDSVEAAAAA